MQKKRFVLRWTSSKRFPAGKLCYLSFEPENAVAARLYHSFGFVENGEFDGNEIVACLPL